MISNRSFVKFSINNTPYYLSLSYIFICLFLALFAFFIIPDKSVNANKMNLNIQSMKPGFKVKTLSIPNKEYNTFKDSFFGYKNYSENYAISDFWFSSDSLNFNLYNKYNEVSDVISININDFNINNAQYNVQELKDLISSKYIKDSTFYPNASDPVNKLEGKVLSSDHIKLKPILELNVIDSAQLVSLRGVGPFYASQIIKYRTKIGGYYKIEQLLEVWKMRPETYEALTEQLFIDSDKVKKLRLNTITFEDLYKHPYLSYAQTNSIVKMRTQSNGFKNITEIKKSKLIDSKTFDKLFPYLIIE